MKRDQSRPNFSEKSREAVQEAEVGDFNMAFVKADVTEATARPPEDGDALKPMKPGTLGPNPTWAQVLSRTITSRASTWHRLIICAIRVEIGKISSVLAFAAV